MVSSTLSNYLSWQIENKRKDGVWCFCEMCRKSLNDLNHPGAKFQQNLIDVLLRLWRYPVVLVCDITEMYFRIGIRPIDQSYQRILWISLKQNERQKML